MIASALNHLFEPTRLLMIWQPVDENATERGRCVVGEISRSSPGTDDWAFSYLRGSDLKKAQSLGFQGFPAYAIEQITPFHGVHDTFMRRLPPKRRTDFSEYLAQHRLPSPFIYSDMALLGYTGGKLPSDGFSFLPDLSAATTPCEFIVEIAGTRHALRDAGLDALPTDLSQLHWGIRAEPSNPKDSNALAVYAGECKLGYLPRPYAAAVSTWLPNRSVRVQFERLNGKPERPLVYCRIHVA